MGRFYDFENLKKGIVMITLSSLRDPVVRIIDSFTYGSLPVKDPNVVYAIYKSGTTVSGATVSAFNLDSTVFPTGTTVSDGGLIILPNGYKWYGGSDTVSGSSTNKFNIYAPNGSLWVYNKSDIYTYWTKEVPMVFAYSGRTVSGHELPNVTMFVGNPPTMPTTLPSEVWAWSRYECHGIDIWKEGSFYGASFKTSVYLPPGGSNYDAGESSIVKYTLNSANYSHYLPNLGWDATELVLYVDDEH